MRRHQDSYRVVIAPEVWANLGSLPQDQYVAVRAALTTLARVEAGRDGIRASGLSDGGAAVEVVQKRVSGLLLEIRMDHLASAVTLVKVSHQSG